MTDPTTPQTLISLIPYLLPPRGTTGSTLLRPTDLVAVVVHAIHVGLEFKLVGTGGRADGQNREERVREQVDVDDQVDDDDDTHSETATAVNDDQDPSSPTPTQPSPHLLTLSTTSPLPPSWLLTSEDSFTFHFTHSQSSLRFLV